MILSYPMYFICFRVASNVCYWKLLEFNPFSEIKGFTKAGLKIFIRLQYLIRSESHYFRGSLIYLVVDWDSFSSNFLRARRVFNWVDGQNECLRDGPVLNRALRNVELDSVYYILKFSFDIIYCIISVRLV